MKYIVNKSSFHAAICQAYDEVSEQPATRITFLTPYLGYYDASFGVMTAKGVAATVEQQWEDDHVVDFRNDVTEDWIGSNPAGAQLIWDNFYM